MCNLHWLSWLLAHISTTCWISWQVKKTADHFSIPSFKKDGGLNLQKFFFSVFSVICFESVLHEMPLICATSGSTYQLSSHHHPSVDWLFLPLWLKLIDGRDLWQLLYCILHNIYFNVHMNEHIAGDSIVLYMYLFFDMLQPHETVSYSNTESDCKGWEQFIRDPLSPRRLLLEVLVHWGCLPRQHMELPVQ